VGFRTVVAVGVIISGIVYWVGTTGCSADKGVSVGPAIDLILPSSPYEDVMRLATKQPVVARSTK
jgi:hypothetical protein